MNVRHGKLTLDVPGGWADTSTIVYISPPEEGLNAALSGRSAPSYRTNVTVSVEVRPDDPTTPAQFLESLGEALRGAGIEVKEISARPFKMGTLQAAIAERRVTLDGQLIRQWTSAAYVGPNVVIATASATESGAAKHEAALLQILASVTLG